MQEKGDAVFTGAEYRGVRVGLPLGVDVQTKAKALKDEGKALHELVLFHVCSLGIEIWKPHRHLQSIVHLDVGQFTMEQFDVFPHALFVVFIHLLPLYPLSTPGDWTVLHTVRALICHVLGDGPSWRSLPAVVRAGHGELQTDPKMSLFCVEGHFILAVVTRDEAMPAGGFVLCQRPSLHFLSAAVERTLGLLLRTFIVQVLLQLLLRLCKRAATLKIQALPFHLFNEVSGQRLRSL
mmetsp:Transcript_1677/g.3454  ORF Transcript_1677/g.3454 Transcript_1677/m.3454 type:complete len:237 (-) Transcript_1677:297-1007(-)